MVTVSGLSFTYPNGKKLSFDDFSIERGRHSLLLGESGSGKTTLLHLLGGLLRGYSGLVKVNQTDLSTLSDHGLDKFRGQHIGYIFQKLHLVKALSVRRNLEMSPWLAGLPATRGHTESVLAGLNLKGSVDSSVATLSQGQAQRVAIARAIMNKPILILADELTSALDDRNCEDVIQLMISTATETGATLVIATHDHRVKSAISNQIHIKAA